MFRVLDGTLYCEGQEVGVRKPVVRNVIREAGYYGDTVVCLPAGIAREMIAHERELLIKDVELSLREVYDAAA